MKYSTIKMAKEFCQDTIDCAEWREVVTSLNNGESDFEAGNYRFIEADEIDTIQQQELASDLYILGCFNAGFLSSILDVDQDVIETLQNAEAFEGIGKLVISLNKLEEVQADYASADGYGHHFNHYDGGQYELTVDGKEYLVFQTN